MQWSLVKKLVRTCIGCASVAEECSTISCCAMPLHLKQHLVERSPKGSCYRNSEEPQKTLGSVLNSCVQGRTV